MKKIIFAAPLYFTSPTKLGGHQYAEQFNKHGWEVFYFSNPLTPFNILLDRGNPDLPERLRIYKSGGVDCNGIKSYVPFTLVPHHNIFFFNNQFFLNNYYRFTAPSLKSVVKKFGIGEVDILWMDCNNQLFWADILKYKKLAYRIPDNILGFKQKSPATIAAHYKIMDKADLILMTSKILLNKLELKYRKKAIYCPNGVDLSRFCAETYTFPEEYRKLPNTPIGLYVGTIDDWFDFEVLKLVAENLPAVSFVIIGPRKVAATLSFPSNVHFFGKRDYSLIPSFIRYCTFGIIPFKNNDLVKYVNPIKMYEFFSLGKPVVSTCWEELEMSGAPVNLADSPIEFINMIKTVLRDMKESDLNLVEYAKANTWENRYNYILKNLGYQ